MEDSAHGKQADDEQEHDYYRHEDAAAPSAGQALYLNHPRHGWMPVLDQFADIESSRVVIALGDSETGAFATLVDTYYSEYADLIFDTDTATGEFAAEFHDSLFTPADDIVANLPTSTPGESNLTACEEQTA